MMFHPASLQAVGSGGEIITMKDENGFERGYAVDTPTYMYVRSIITGWAAIGNPQQALAASSTVGAHQNVAGSLGSLPSLSSLRSSQGSIASQVSQASSFSTTPGR